MAEVNLNKTVVVVVRDGVGEFVHVPNGVTPILIDYDNLTDDVAEVLQDLKQGDKEPAQRMMGEIKDLRDQCSELNLIRDVISLDQMVNRIRGAIIKRDSNA